ncbi:hypothetical protein HK405_014176 [Cladochytrium tenue]|nr:hypothetical protein HK405_014176 [Cladochytrium tenue]
MIATADNTATAKPPETQPNSVTSTTASAVVTAKPAAALAAAANGPAATVYKSTSNPFTMFRLSKTLPPVAAVALLPSSTASSSSSSSDAARPKSARQSNKTYKSRGASYTAIPAVSTVAAISPAITPSRTVIRGVGTSSLSDPASAAEDAEATSALPTASGKQSRRVRNAKARLSLQNVISSGPHDGDRVGEPARARRHGRHGHRRVAFSDGEASVDGDRAAGLTRTLSADSLRHAPLMTWSPTTSSSSSMSVNYEPLSLTDDAAQASDPDTAAAARISRRRWSLTFRLPKKSKRTARGSSPPPTLSPLPFAPATSSLPHSHLSSPSASISSHATSGTPGLPLASNAKFSHHASLERHVGMLSTAASARRPRAPLLSPAAVETPDAAARPLALGAGPGGTLTVRHTQACPIPPLSLAVAADTAASVVQRRASYTSGPAILQPPPPRARAARSPPAAVRLHSPTSLPPPPSIAASKPVALIGAGLDHDGADRRATLSVAAAADPPYVAAASPTKSGATVPYRGRGKATVIGGHLPMPLAPEPAAMVVLALCAAACLAIAVACAMVVWRLQRVLVRLDSL